MNPKLILKLAGLAAVSLLSACTSLVPAEIKQPVEGSPSVDQVHHQLDAHKSKKVRWGGIILENVSKQNASWLKIIALPLYAGGEPLSTDQSPGRFIAIVNHSWNPRCTKVIVRLPLPDMSLDMKHRRLASSLMITRLFR